VHLVGFIIRICQNARSHNVKFASFYVNRCVLQRNNCISWCTDMCSFNFRILLKLAVSFRNPYSVVNIKRLNATLTEGRAAIHSVCAN
jgi:hypothetical protein